MTSLSLNNKVRQRPYSSYKAKCRVIKIIKSFNLYGSSSSINRRNVLFYFWYGKTFTTMLLIPSAAYVYTIKTPIMHKKISSAMKKQTISLQLLSIKNLKCKMRKHHFHPLRIQRRKKKRRRTIKIFFIPRMSSQMFICL